MVYHLRREREISRKWFRLELFLMRHAKNTDILGSCIFPSQTTFGFDWNGISSLSRWAKVVPAERSSGKTGLGVSGKLVFNIVDSSSFRDKKKMRQKKWRRRGKKSQSTKQWFEERSLESDGFPRPPSNAGWASFPCNGVDGAFLLGRDNSIGCSIPIIPWHQHQHQVSGGWSPTGTDGRLSSRIYRETLCLPGDGTLSLGCNALDNKLSPRTMIKCRGGEFERLTRCV